MSPSDSEDDPDLNDVFDEIPSSEAEDVNEEELFGENGDDATDHGDNSGSDEDDDDVDGDADGDADNDGDGDGDGDGDEDEDEDEEMQDGPAVQRDLVPLSASVRSPSLERATQHIQYIQEAQQIEHSPAVGQSPSAISPALERRAKILASVAHPRSYTVEAICAIAHPEPTHSLAASLCMTHLLTGSQDGYIRDYDVFAAVNGKTFLTAPQRAHCAVVENTMKAGQLRMWWENPGSPGAAASDAVVADTSRSPVTSLAMHSDALWALGGTEKGHINLFTVRHEPGQFITAMHGHRNHVSSLALQHDELGFFSAGWDGDVYQWDLNTGHQVRKFTSTGAQVAVVAVRPEGPILSPPPPAPPSLSTSQQNGGDKDDDAKSDASYDPLFDEPDEDEGGPSGPKPAGAVGLARASGPVMNPRGPPALTSETYGAFSPDVLMTASVDGSVVLWDRRVNDAGRGVGRLETSNKTPPWCVSACWSADGGQVYAGRRNSTVDVWDTRQFGSGGVAGVPRLLKTLRNPVSSGAVSCVASFPDGRHIAVASNDNIRLWNANDAGYEAESAGGGGGGAGVGRARSGVPFKIIPGHHGGIVSQMIIDRAARFMVSASSNRGWGSGESTRVVLVHDVKHIY